LSVYRTSTTGEEIENVTLKADSFDQLRREHPREIEQILRPLLQVMHQEMLFAADPFIAWQVFAEQWKPDAKVKQEVEQRLAVLGDADGKARDRALRELAELGSPAALFIRHLNRDGMNLEQNARLDALTAGYAWLSDREAAKLRDDPGFLFDCLMCPDKAIRPIAKAHLDKLFPGKTIEVDVNADTSALVAAVGQARAKLLKVPSTQPMR
jgi:hypothetical protein